MNYLLDTCVVSDFVKGDPLTLKHLKEHSPRRIAISSITYMEIMFGLALNPQRAKNIESIIHSFLHAISVLHFDEKDAECAGKIRAMLREKGTPIGAYDVLLAGTAIARDMIFVSSNVKEFQRINGLVLENWRV